MSDELNDTNVPGDAPERRAGVGTHVTIEIQDKAGTIERLEFELVPDKQSDYSSGLMSERAPLAQAILGHGRGETVQYIPPSGNEQSVTILSVEPSSRKPDQPASDRTQVLDETMDKIARRESRQIALTTELHYGSIDPDGIEE